jgi:4-alpha-glucanotransferase
VPPGWHTLRVTAGAEQAEAVLISAPDTVEPAGTSPDRVWGWMVQLYALISHRSWGIGDYADLRELARWSGAELGADVLLANPLHAPSPVLPLENSPYYPSSRRFRSPLYLRIENVPEFRAAPEAVREQVASLRPAYSADRIGPERIDRDAIWTAKRAALELLAGGLRTDELAAYREAQGSGLEDFATFCALAEERSVPWQTWPPELHRPDTAAVTEARARLADRITFHAWLQMLCDEQLAAAGAAAEDAGMSVGIVHDLAVGVDPGGADAWGLRDVLVDGVTIGAPPDNFSQQGQDWRLPPWHPERLAAAGYAPYRDMLRAALRSAGGVRVDHVMGLFRLWWVPEGSPSSAGTYVGYDEEALLGVLALEARRAGALVVGEDLGTVEPRVAAALAARGVLGSNVVYFEYEDPAETGGTGGTVGPGSPAGTPQRRPPHRWRPGAAASVTTHDLPTAAGYLAGEQVRIRAELGVLVRSEADEWDDAAEERRTLLALLRSEGLLPESIPGGVPDSVPGGPAEPSTEEIIRAMHALLGRTPARMVLVSPGDAVGDLRQPNLPGTTDEYPNWRLPLAVPRPDGSHRAVPLEEFMASERVRRLAADLALALRAPH